MAKKSSQAKLTNWQKTALNRPEFLFIKKIIKQFPEAKIYLVGGAVRDIILNRPTADFDFVIAKVEVRELEKFLSRLGKVNLVGKSFGVLKFNPRTAEEKIEPIDIALPRTEHAGMSGGYQDFRIQSDKNLPIEKDLSRRDFTINALAWDLIEKKLIDKSDGLEDLENKTIRTVGQPQERFQEDYTRIIRAVRFACQLDFAIAPETLKAIKAKAKKIPEIPKERINEEFTKIILSPRAEKGIRLLAETKIIKTLIPELAKGIGVSQNKAHIYQVFEHNVRSLGAAAERNYSLEIRLAALFHDVAKPETKQGRGKTATFYNHDKLGAKIARQALERLGYSKEIIKKTTHLIRYHMFYYALDTVSDAGVRRLLNRLGRENINNFIKLRIADRLGMGRPKAKPWKLIELEKRFQEVQLDPITPKMLAIDGRQLMKLLKIKPGPRIGMILNALLGEILENPEKNNQEYLKNRSKELVQFSDRELKKLHPDLAYYQEERKRMLQQKK